MERRFAYTFLFILTFFTNAHCQEDSPYTDTVIIVKPPLVIKQQVYISVPVYLKKEAVLDVGAYYTVNKNIAPNSQSVTGIVQSTGFQVRYHEGHVEIGLGVGVMTAAVTYSIQKERDQQVIKSQKVFTVDSSTCGTSIYPWGVFTTCDTVFSTIQVQLTEKIPYSVENKVTLDYLQIPISLGYAFRKENWYLTPTLQLVYNKRLGKMNEMLPQKEEVWMAGFQLNIGRTIFKHVQVEIKTQYQSTLSAIYDDSPYQQDNWKLLGAGLGIYYRF